MNPRKAVTPSKRRGSPCHGFPCGRIGNTTVNIGTISGGAADNIVPDRCSFTGEIRSFSDEEAHREWEKIADILQHTADQTGTQSHIQSTVRVTAYRVDPAHPVVNRFKTACGTSSSPGPFVPDLGGSDNNSLVRHGVSGIVVATAMNNCHSCSEYTTAEDLERAANLALELMLSKE